MAPKMITMIITGTTAIAANCGSLFEAAEGWIANRTSYITTHNSVCYNTGIAVCRPVNIYDNTMATGDYLELIDVTVDFGMVDQMVNGKWHAIKV